MAGFTYFAPVSVQPTLAQVREWGLGYAFSKEPATRQIQGGPNGANGFVFHDSKRQDGRSIGYHADKQTWRKIPCREEQQELWVGYWNDAKPGPADLARPDMLGGYVITMADGNDWQLPLIRSFDTDAGEVVSQLPAPYGLDENGKLTRGQVAETHRWLWDLTEPVWQDMVAEREASDQSLLDCAAKLLGANYAIDVVETAGLLQLFSPRINPVGLVALAMDYTTWKSWADAKKKQQTPESDSSTGDGLNTPLGEMDEADAMPQLALTS